MMQHLAESERPSLSMAYSDRPNLRKRPLHQGTVDDKISCTDRVNGRINYLRKGQCYLAPLLVTMYLLSSFQCTAFHVSYSFNVHRKSSFFNHIETPTVTIRRRVHVKPYSYLKTNVLPLYEQKSSDTFEGFGATNNTTTISANQSTTLPIIEHSTHSDSLIQQPLSTNQPSTASFGDVVSLKHKPSTNYSDRDPVLLSTITTSKTMTSDSTSLFGDVVPLRKNGPLNPEATTDVKSAPNTKGTTISEERQVANQIRFRNTVVAVLSIAVAIGNFVYQYLHPIEPIQILFDLQQSSADISVVGKNHKPTIIDFWAPWCENCKLSAATLQSIENQYGNDVNFILINGDLASSWPYIEALGVDAIPHMSMISYDGVVETALIGPIPKHILQEDIDVLLLNSRNNAEAIRTTSVDAMAGESSDTVQEPNQPPAEHVELPHKMLDVFAGKSASAHRVQF